MIYFEKEGAKILLCVLLILSISLLSNCSCGGGETDLHQNLPYISIEEPHILDFGQVPVGDNKTASIEVTNSGDGILTLKVVKITDDTDKVFSISNFPDTIDPSKTGNIDIVFTPLDITDYQAYLSITSNDPNNKTVKILLKGRGVEKPEPDIRVCTILADGSEDCSNPTEWTYDDNVLMRAKIKNMGNGTLEIYDYSFEPPSESANFEVIRGGFPPTVKIDPGTEIDFYVRYRPPDNQQHEALLKLETNDPQDEFYKIYLHGNIPGPIAIAWIEEETGALVKHSNPVVDPTNKITLDGTMSIDPMGTIDSYEWSLDEYPESLHYDSVETLMDEVFDPVPEYSDSEKIFFKPIVIGHYTVTLTITGYSGTDDDQVFFDVVPEDDLYVQLTWDNSLSDLDLHLVSESKGGKVCGETPHDDTANVAICQKSDCNFFSDPACHAGSQQHLDWGMQGDNNDDPSLKKDDPAGFGPEIITIKKPQTEPYCDSYTVYVSCFSNCNTTSTASVVIYINGENVTDPPLRKNISNSGLEYRRNMYWRVGTINWCDKTFSPCDDQTESCTFIGYIW